MADPTGRAAPSHLAVEVRRLRSDLRQLAQNTAVVMTQAALSRRAIAAGYRRMAHFGDHRSAYYDQRAADFDQLALRAQLFAESEFAVAAQPSAQEPLIQER